MAEKTFGRYHAQNLFNSFFWGGFDLAENLSENLGENRRKSRRKGDWIERRLMQPPNS